LGGGAICRTAQSIWTADDLGFDGNQSLTAALAIPPTGGGVHQNTFLLARTLRATDNRFLEPAQRPQQVYISLVTRTDALNNTNDNQGDHCIFAANTAPGKPPNVAGNQVIDNTLCGGLATGVIGAISAFPISGVIRG
jgi:hypothetical protein